MPTSKHPVTRLWTYSKFTSIAGFPIAMPIKCSFCRRRYARAGPFEKHLRTAHSNLDVILASTVRRIAPTDDIHVASGAADVPNKDNANGEKEQLDSDYESEVSCGGSDAGRLNVACESDTEPLDVDRVSSSATRRADYPGAGQSIGDVKGFEEELDNLSEDPWAPFSTPHEFKLASWFIRSKVPKSRINEYFSTGLGTSASAGFTSMYTLEARLRQLDPYGPYLQWFEGQVDDGTRRLPFFYRNVLDCVRYLLRQITYTEDLVYAPRREYDANGQRVYAEMHTADWWWDIQVQCHIVTQLLLAGAQANRSQDALPRGATVVPIIGMSDQTHLSNFSGDQKAWPVYITVGNLPSTTRNRPGSMAVLLLALLPVPPKLANSASANELQRQINADTLQGVFQLIFEPLQDAAQAGVPVDCADGRVRRCFPILAAWTADHMENVALHGVKSNACPKCEVPPDRLGSLIQNGYPTRDYATYERLQQGSLDHETDSVADDINSTFEGLGVKIGRNVFHGLPRVLAPDLYKPDLLHTVYLGLFKHMMDWVQSFLKKHARS
jgi:hypothetical protein